jgi:hypothetical protein
VTQDDALRRSAEHAAAYAHVLDQRVRDLTEADEVRAGWYVHTAETRAAADRARAELADRGVDPDAPADAVTAPEWLAERDGLIREEDTHRPVTTADLADGHADSAPTASTLETDVADIRDTTRAVPTVVGEGRGRVATAERTAAAVERAQRALLELRARAAADERAAEEIRHIEQAQRSTPRVAEREAVVELVD